MEILALIILLGISLASLNRILHAFLVVLQCSIPSLGEIFSALGPYHVRGPEQAFILTLTKIEQLQGLIPSHILRGRPLYRDKGNHRTVKAQPVRMSLRPEPGYTIKLEGKKSLQPSWILLKADSISQVICLFLL